MSVMSETELYLVEFDWIAARPQNGQACKVLHLSHKQTGSPCWVIVEAETAKEAITKVQQQPGEYLANNRGWPTE